MLAQRPALSWAPSVWLRGSSFHKDCTPGSHTGTPRSRAQSYFISLCGFHSTLRAANQLCFSFLRPFSADTSRLFCLWITATTMRYCCFPTLDPFTRVSVGFFLLSDLCGPFSCNIMSTLSSLSCFMLCCCSDHIKHSPASTWSDTKAKV